MKRSAYSDKYKDPRWQKMRLQVMQRDGFRCQDCGSESKTLNVHHTYYVSGRSPWEYPDGTLLTLCEDCHLNDPYDQRKGIAGWEGFVEIQAEARRHSGSSIDFLSTMWEFSCKHDWPMSEILGHLMDGLSSGKITVDMLKEFGDQRRMEEQESHEEVDAFILANLTKEFGSKP